MFKKIFLLFVCLISLTQFSYSQKVLKGRILDYYTNMAYVDPQTHISLLSADSVFIADGNIMNNRNQRTHKNESIYYFSIRQEGKYIIKCTNPNCETVYSPLSIRFYKHEQIIEGNDIRLKKKLSKELELPEVMVKATKLKFYFNKDTLVYNTETFSTQYGFVLNDLLKKMPGISIGSNYDIYMNGRKIEELLLNGKNFFNNDRESLIENLPAYMIKNIKVYEHVDSIKLFKKLNKLPPLALDVRLKKGYNSSVLGNIDLGAGTDSRYFCRAFGMKIHDIYRWTAFAASNNTNHNEQIDHNGQLYNMDDGTGDKKFHIMGINYNVDSRIDAYNLEGKFRIQGSNEKQIINKLDEFFLNNDDLYRFMSQKSNFHNFSVQTNHVLEFFPRKSYTLTLTPAFSYIHSKGNVDLAQLSANNNIADIIGNSWVDSISSKTLSEKLLMYGINRVLNKKKTPTNSLQTALKMNQRYAIPHTKNIVGLELSGTYAKQNTDNYENYGINYISNPQHSKTWKNLYTSNNNKNFLWSAKSSYSTVINNIHSFQLSANYDHRYVKVDKNNYNLASLLGWGMDTEYELGMLPSELKLLDALDKGNSYMYQEYLNKYTLDMKYSLSFHGKNLEVTLPLSLQKKNLHFYQSNNNQNITRQMFSPDLTIKLMKWKNGKIGTSYVVNLAIHKTMLESFNLVNQRNDIYDVVVSQGNQHLKNTTNYMLSGSLTWNPVIMHTHILSMSYNYYQNKIGTALFYDKTNGKYLYTPKNINGNQDYSAILNSTFYLDKSYKHKLSNLFSCALIKSIDFSGASTSEYDKKSTVHNTIISEKLEYLFSSRNTKYIGSVAPYLTYHRSSSNRLGFDNINAFIFGMQISSRLELPFSFRFNSELKSESRRGYLDNSMNDNEIIWNMGLTKSFKNNIMLSLNAVDILGQRKNIHKYITAQATSETISNVLKRHVMFHFIWQFSSKKINR